MNWTLKTIRDRCIDDGDCWVWTQGCNGPGYPCASIGGKRGLNVRKIAYELSGRSLRRGGIVASSCFNPKCCNPDHLIGLTRSQLVKRCFEHGRFNTEAFSRAARQRAIDQGRVRLSFEKAREIRARHVAGEIQTRLAEEYGVSPDTISKIVRNLMWRDVAANSSVFTWTGS